MGTPQNNLGTPLGVPTPTLGATALIDLKTIDSCMDGHYYSAMQIESWLYSLYAIEIGVDCKEASDFLCDSIEI